MKGALCMASVFAFRPWQYAGGTGDVSGVVAPPYDVLDTEQKAALLSKDERNIVSVDLPQVPAKELGPPEAYAGAASRLREWISEGVLTRSDREAIFAYRQRFTFEGRGYERCGVACCVETRPFGAAEGGGILPHEETFSGPKEDRIALMRATRTQLSPIFGLHPDEDGAASGLAREVMASRGADLTAEMGDGVTHEVWRIEDEGTIGRYREALAGEDVFIADGHHRYTTAVNYRRELEKDGSLAEGHPATRTMIVLVGMNDPGLAIGPTHRVLGGMKDYGLDGLLEGLSPYFHATEVTSAAEEIEREMFAQAPTGMDTEAFGAGVLGLMDFESGRRFVLSARKPDLLLESHGEKSRAWRLLDVALVQEVIVERVCRPVLNGGAPVKWAFPHSVREVVEIGLGKETGAGGGSGFAQMAVIVRPTPMEAVKAVSRAGELMPQKSTFFYPKLATGLWLHSLEA